MRRGARGLQLVQWSCSVGEMYLLQRRIARRHAEPLQHSGGQGFRNMATQIAQQTEELATNPARAQLRSAQAFIDGRNAPHLQAAELLCRLGKYLELWLDHLETTRRARGLHLAEDGDSLASLKTVLQIGPTKPDALQRSDALSKRHLEDGHCASAQQDGAAYFANDARHLAGDQLIESARIGAIFVAEGKVIEEVFRGADFLFG